MVGGFIFTSVLQICFVQVRISRSISGRPLYFEITRVDCTLDHWVHLYYFGNITQSWTRRREQCYMLHYCSWIDPAGTWRVYNPACILYKSIAGRYRPVSYPDLCRMLTGLTSSQCRCNVDVEATLYKRHVPTGESMKQIFILSFLRCCCQRIPSFRI